MRLRIDAGTFLLAIVVMMSCCAWASAADPPNIVLIISDDQAWTDFGFMGHETIRTPNLDRLNLPPKS